MEYCPFCGHLLEEILTDGISSCLNCHRVFDSSKKNRLLSAAWAIRRTVCEDISELKHFDYFSSEEIKVLYEYIIDKQYTHDEFLKVI